MNSNTNEEQLEATNVNLFSKMIAGALGRITCPVHERCDGSCLPDGPIRFEAPCYGERPFDVHLKFEKSTLPPEPTPIPLPTEVFQYSVIESHNGHIRLLRVLPAVFLVDPVVVELVDAMLDNPPAYTALSYHWGPALFDHAIICDGKTLHVNKSLHDALKRHRQEVLCASERPELLWADAICINQKDEKELNEQLLLMQQIYHKAEPVYVDLGNVPLEWHLAFDLMMRVNMVKEAIGPVSSSRSVSIGLAPEKYGLPSFDHLAWRMFIRTFASAWFFRTWIIQEVSLAHAVFVRYGRFTFSWDLLSGTFQFLYYNDSDRRMLNDTEAAFGWLNLQKIRDIRDAFRRGNLTPIELLGRARDFNVSDPRDKIIGLLGLLPQDDHLFRPDYSWSTTQLFHQFAIYVIGSALEPRLWGSEDRKALLSYAGLQRQPDGSPLPSWAPDWAAQSGKGPKVYSTIRKRPYAAAMPRARVLGQTSEDFSEPAAGLFVLKDEPGLLCVLSLKVDTITAMSSNYPPGHEEDRHPYDEWKVWHNDAEKVFRDATLHQTSRYANPEDAFSRTLLVDDTYSGIDAMGEYAPIDDPSEFRLRMVMSRNTSQDPSLSSTDGMATYRMQTATACYRRRFAMTSNGYMGLVPQCSEIGDIVYLFAGFSIPFVLRPRHDDRFVLVGDAYLHGIMEGEFWKDQGIRWPFDWAPVLLC